MARSPRTQEERRTTTRRAILTSARFLFGKHGYDGCSVDNITERAGVAKGSFYRHFPDKVTVFEAVFADLEEEYVARTAELLTDQLPTLDTFFASVEDFYAWCEDPAVRQTVLYDAPVVLGWERWHELDDRYNLELLEAGLRQGIADGELRMSTSPRMVGRMLIAAVAEGAHTIARADDPGSARADAIAALRELTSGLRRTRDRHS